MAVGSLKGSALAVAETEAKGERLATVESAFGVLTLAAAVAATSGCGSASVGAAEPIWSTRDTKTVVRATP